MEKIKKILLCSPYSSSFTKPVHAALVKLGYEVQIFDYQKGNLISRGIGYSFNKFKLPVKLTQAKITSYINGLLITKVKALRPDLIFVIKGDSITNETLSQLRTFNNILLNWYPDWMTLWDWIKPHANLYDFFFNMSNDVEQALKKNHPHTAFIPPAIEPDRKLSINRTLPITFIGQFTKRRERYFSKIADLGLHIWGYKKWQYSSLREISLPSVNNEKCLNIIRSSQIAVNILTGEDNFEPYAINLRTFEALGTGTFMLVRDHPLLYRYFKPKRDFITFTTPSDLRVKTKYYLAHEAERKLIAKQGWQTVKTHHTYEIRLKELLSRLH